MDDAPFAIAVAFMALAGVLGIAYSLDARRQRRGPVGLQLPPPGRVGRSLWWGARILVALMMLSISGAYIFREPAMAWLALGCAVVFLADHLIYRVVRLTGK
jgi:hypothetical protein